jgi:type IV secretion system protein VirB9
MSCRLRTGVCSLLLMVASGASMAEDNRLRSQPFDPGRVYRLRGFVGYQIDLEFETGERFVGIGAGDIDGIGYAAEGNHLFIKPRAARVRTNLTVLTTRRTYHFDYRVVSASGPEEDSAELIYTLRFSYPEEPAARQPMDAQANASRSLDQPADSPPNRDYWYCGSPSLRPISAYDDGVATHLRFNPRAELPALFVRNEDGSESLLNFSVHEGEVLVHRIAHRLIVRRGLLEGCILNRGFEGVGRELSSGTVNPAVERATREPTREH